MKKITMLLTIGATVAMLALPVVAQTTAPAAAPAASGQECPPEQRDALYKTFTENRTADQAKAYDAAKKYLACPVATPTESQTKIIEYLNRWVGLYEKGSKKNKFIDELYVKKNYVEAFKLGKEILAEEPDNVKVVVDMGANGYLVGPLNNPTLTAEAIEYARKGLQLLGSGKTVEDWTPLQNANVATAYLNYTIGSLTVEKEPEAALKHLIKSVQFETPLKKSAFTYALIAGAYETGTYAKQSAEYKEKFGGKDETPESKLALANIHQIVDRMIDGYARAVALAGPDLASQKATWNESLKQWYKFRNNDSDTGMDALVAGILSKPLPPEPTPLTSLPATPASTSTTGTPGATTTGTPAGNGTGNGAATPAKPAATPAATPAQTNAKPAPKKPRR